MIPTSRFKTWAIVVVLTALVAARCADDQISGPGPVLVTATFVGAGDIGDCNFQAAEATAKLLDRIEGTVFTVGDNAYPNGSRANYRDCYDPSWGRHKDRTRPTPGNHEYDTPGASAYFDYFEFNAGPPGQGYYSYGLGAWRAYALDSRLSMSMSSTQTQWVRKELEAQPATRCVVAYWHEPLYSSGPHGSNPRYRELWSALQDGGVDLIVNGHEHLYERFAPQNNNGQLDNVRGIRQFTVGTGGSHLSPAVGRAPNSERVISEHGVLKLTLEIEAYSWEFISINGAVRDSGRANCH